MPRAIVYKQRDPAKAHLDALVASQPVAPTPEQMTGLKAEAADFATKASPESVLPHYLAKVALEPDALDAADRANWWAGAVADAASGKPASAEAVALASTATPAEPASVDGFMEKVAKYLPAESITITTLAFAALTPKGAAVWWLVVAGAVANVLYLFGTALQARKEAPMPPFYFYVLSAAALTLWSIAVVSVVGTEAGIKGSNAEAQKTFVLALAAFAIPLADVVITGLKEMGAERKARRKKA